MTTDQKLGQIGQNLEILTVHVGRLTEGLTEFRADTAEIKEMIRQQIIVNRDLAETVRQQGEQQTASLDRLSEQITRQGEQIARQGEQIARQGEQQEQASRLFREDLAEIKAMIRENAEVARQQADVVSRLTGIVEQLIQNRS